MPDTLTLSPDEVEDASQPVSLNSSEVEDAPLHASSSAPSIDYQHPAGVPGGSAPGVPRPTVNMQPVPSGAHAVMDAIGNADSRGMQRATVTGLDGKPATVLVPNYGQNAIPDLIKGSDEFMIPGQSVQGATDMLRGVNEGMSSSLLPVGAAPGAVIGGAVGSAAGSYAAPKVVKALGGSQQQQDLAREAGAALPLAAGVGADLLRGGVSTVEPEILPPSRVTGIYQEAGAPRSLPSPETTRVPQLEAGEGPALSQQPAPQAPPPLNESTARTRVAPTQTAPNPVPSSPRGMVVDEQGNIAPAPAGLLPGHAPTGADLAQSQELQGYLATHPAGKVTAIDEETGLPIVKRQQPSPTLSAQGEWLPPQTGTAGRMSPEAEAVSAAAASNQGAKPEAALQNPVNASVGSPAPAMDSNVTQPSENRTEPQNLATAVVPESKSKPGTMASTDVTPATHDFDVTRWLQANPQGDAVRARNKAMGLGYRVVGDLASLDPSEVEPAEGEHTSSAAEPTTDVDEKAKLPDGLEERYGGFGAIDPTKLLPDPVRQYLAHEAGLVGKSREIHGGIYDLDAQHDADVLRANNLMKELPGTPADQEAVYHYLENSGTPLTKTQREILDKLAPLNKEAERIYQKLNPDKRLVPGYVHRIVQDRGGLLDRILHGSESTGRGNVLQKSAAAGKKRSMMALESVPGGNTRKVVSVGRGRVTEWNDNVPTDVGGLRSGLTRPDEILDDRLASLEREEKRLNDERKVLRATQSRQASSSRRLQNIAARLQEIEADRASIEHEHTAENLPDKMWRDKNGRLWKFKQATTKEIEAHTPIEYYKNAAASTVTNWLELRKAERAADFIEKVKSDPEFGRFGIKPKNPGQIPQGWKSTQLPQFTGYYFEPHVAEVFDHYAKQLAQGKPGVLQQIGDFLTTSIFLNPLSHIPNLTSNWLTEKGVNVANPLTWGREFKAGVKAFNAVVHQNQDFLEALDAGAPMQSQRTAVRQFADLLIEKLQDEAQDPSVAEKLAEALGKAVNVPAVLKTVVNFMADKSTWPVHDMYFLQSAYSKVTQNPSLTLKQALEDTAKYIPDERLPTRVFNSKAVADVMQNPLLTMFSRYHYGVLKGYGQVLKNLAGAGFEEAGTNAKGEPVNKAGRTADQEKIRALNIAAGLSLMLAVVYPALDELAEKATGNKDARVRRAGYSNFADALRRAIEGDVTPLQAARSVVTPAVLTETAVDLAANRDVFGTGRKIYNQHGDKKEIAEQVGRRLAESVSPAQLAMRASDSPESLKRTLYSLIGVSFPQHGAVRYAAELRAEHVPDTAETPEQRKKAMLRSQARYLAWQGDQSGMDTARKSGLFTGREMERLEREAKEDPLIYEAKGLNLEDFRKLYRFRGTTDAERKKLGPLLVLKTARAGHRTAHGGGYEQ